MSYVEQRNGGYYLTGTRVSLDSVVYRFVQGLSPEEILQSYPLIGSLERVYGAITFYLANKGEIDGYLRSQEEHVKKMREENPPPAHLKARIDKAREEMLAKRG